MRRFYDETNMGIVTGCGIKCFIIFFNQRNTKSMITNMYMLLLSFSAKNQ